MKVESIILGALSSEKVDNNEPGGYYFIPRLMEDGSILVEEGEYGRWHRTLKVVVEEVEYIEY